MVLRQATVALSLTVVGLCSLSGAFAHEQQLLALNAPVRAASDPALQQAVELLSKNPKAKSGQIKRGNKLHAQPAYDATVVKHRENLDKVLILGGAEAIPM